MTDYAGLQECVEGEVLASRFDRARYATVGSIYQIMPRAARAEIEALFPSVLRHVGGYNIDALPGDAPHSGLLLVGSKGTLALTKSLDLGLSPTLWTKRLGVCHFPTFHAAMGGDQHIVRLGPVAPGLVNYHMIRLGRDIAQFGALLDSFLRGDPQALLLVEFAETPGENCRRLKAPGDLMDAPGRAPCYGRTYLSAGLADQAKAEPTRTTDAFRAARADTVIVADGFSRRFQIKDVTQSAANGPAVVLDRGLGG